MTFNKVYYYQTAKFGKDVLLIKVTQPVNPFSKRVCVIVAARPNNQETWVRHSGLPSNCAFTPKTLSTISREEAIAIELTL